MTSLLFIASMMMCAILWRLRGMRGWPFTALFSLLIGCTLYPVIGPEWASLYALWVFLGEGPGWKPKWYKEYGDYRSTALYGFLIGGIGAILVPLSVWLHKRTPVPAKYRKWIEPNELYFGALFYLTIQLICYIVTN